jgi:hypothetical protein
LDVKLKNSKKNIKKNSFVIGMSTKKSLKIPKGGNLPEIEEGQTIQ